MIAASPKSKVSINLRFPSVLALIFIVLKLTGVIAWSWVWVLSPLWICAAIGFVFWVSIAVALALNFSSGRR